MPISYNPLWKLLIDKGLKRTDLRELIGISPGTLAKLGKNGNINTDIIAKICVTLDCQPADIMEYIHDKQ